MVKKSEAKSAKKKSASAKKQSFSGFVFKWLFIFGVFFTLIIGSVLLWYGSDLPRIMREAQFDRRTAITVLANDGSVIARYGDHKGQNLSVEDLPEYLPNAVIAIEDKRFHYHFGVDPIGILRAMYVNAFKNDGVQGGSTITQQLAKNLFLTRDRKLARKIKEAMLAVWLEAKLSKDEILSAYLNRVYLGGGAYGIDAASRVYYNKPASELTLLESATIAGLLKAPSRYSPKSNPEASKKRANLVLMAMEDQGYITKEELKKVMKEGDMPTPDRKPTPQNDERFFTDWVIEQIDGYTGQQREDMIVETTLDPNVQDAASETILSIVRANGEEKGFSQGAAMVLRPDGSIVAMVGGVDYGHSQFNRATQALRSPGSSFKPIVYLTALRQGWSMDSMVVDAPIQRGKYQPRNFGGKYYGEISLYGALTLSLNTVAVNLAKSVGINNVIETARLMGVTADLMPNLSTALGSNGVPMIQMASVYASIATNGLAIEPFGIKRIKTVKGDVIYEHENIKPPQVIPGYPVTQLKEMMNSVVRQGTGTGANPGFYAAGKTGTSQEYRDAWFNGFTNSYVATVWFGNDDNSPTKQVTGGSFPARAWRQIIVAAHNDPTPSQYTQMMGSGTTGGSLLTRIFSFGESSENLERIEPANNNSRRPSNIPGRDDQSTWENDPETESYKYND